MGGGGKGGSDKAKIDPEARKYAAGAVFKPYTLTTSVGTTAYEPDTGFSIGLSQPLLDLQQQGYLGAQQLVGGIPEAFGREVTPFAFERDLAGRTSDIFREQSALLEPAFAQQRQQLQSDLFGSGRMGLMLAGEAAGAGAGGMVSPDAFGLGRAQSETLANLAAQSRQQALGEQLQAYEIEQGIFGINEALQQQRAQNLLAGTQGLFGLGSSVTATEQDLLKLGLAAESARGGSYADAASALGANTRPDQQGPDLLGSAVQGATAAAMAYAMSSDIRLKENIVKIGKYGSGLNMYTWDWNEEGKKIAHPDQPTVGVMAQEAMLVFPEAVMKGDDGYLRVDYGRIS